MSGDQAIYGAALNHVVRHIRSAPVDEAAHDIVAPIELSDRSQLVLVQKALDGGSVEFLGDAPTLPVDEISHLGPVGKRDSKQIAEGIVRVGGRLARFGLGEQVPFGGVRVR